MTPSPPHVSTGFTSPALAYKWVTSRCRFAWSKPIPPKAARVSIGMVPMILTNSGSLRIVGVGFCKKEPAASLVGQPLVQS
jgi:hypothetical protein